MPPTWIASVRGGPRRVNHAAVILGNYMVVIGGYYTGLNFRPGHKVDVCILILHNLTWERLIISTRTAPFMRYGHTAVVYNNDIYIWGGRNDITACNILYKLNLQKRKWSMVSTTGKCPRARDGHAACMIGSKMYVFGGYLDEPYSIFATGLSYVDLATGKWHDVHTQGPEPPCRDFHCMVALDKKLYLFGGRGTEHPPYHSNNLNYPCDLHIWDERTSTWSVRPRGQDGPIGRRSLSMFVYKDEIYTFGGFNATLSRHFNDIYKYSPGLDKWAALHPRGTPPCPRRRQTCLVLNDCVYVFGGTSPDGAPLTFNLGMDDDDGTSLLDLNDLFILDLKSSLRTLCMQAVLPLDYKTMLPKSLAQEIAALDPRRAVKSLSAEGSRSSSRRRRR